MKILPKSLARRLESMLHPHRSDSPEDPDSEYQLSSQSSAGRTHSNTSRPKLSRRADPLEVAATLPVIESLTHHLQDTARDLQDSVLQISTGFGGMAARARETVEIAQSGLHSEDGINTDSTICEIRNVLHELLSSVQESSQLSSRMATRIGELELVLSNVNASLRKVEKIADEARIVGLNGRLEAARAGQYGAAFNVVANETKNLGVHAADTSSSIRLLVDKLDESLKSVSAELQSRMSLDAETVKNSQNTVSRLLDQLGLMHHGMTSSLHRTEAVSESLSQEIGRSVMALQFQDRVNQRIDHVVEALVALRENLTPFEREVSPTRVEARAGDWRQWLESRSTMKSERDVISSSGSAAASGGNSDFGSIELF